jgi:type I restriction enzyme S subunit
MSSEWPYLRIGEIGTVTTGKTPSTSKPENFDGAFPFITIPDLGQGRDILHTARSISNIGATALGNTKIPAKAVLMSCIATIGKTGITTKPSFTNQQINSVICGTGVIPEFLYYVFCQLGPEIEAAGGGGSVFTNVSKSKFSDVRVPVPPLPVQRNIVNFLTPIDDRITLLRETNTTLEAIAQALFKSWFVDFDPVHAKMQGRAPEGMDEATAALFPDSFEESALGSVPNGWRVGNLNVLAELNPESWSAKRHPERVLYVDLANTKAGQIDEYIEFSFEDAPSRARRVLRCGDVIVGTVRPGNRSFARIASDVTGLTGSTGFAVLRAREVVDQALVFIAATNDEAIDRLSHLADGGAYPAVRPEVVGSTPLVVAPEEIRNSFGDIANTLFASIGANQERMTQLASLRDTLLPHLISGQIDLNTL